MNLKEDNSMKESTRATYQDVLNAPPHMVAQIVDGTLYLQSRPTGEHSRAHTVIVSKLMPNFDSIYGRQGGWWILTEPELHLGNDILVPDIGGWQCERVPEFPGGPFQTIAPDWICEFLSPSTRSLDVGIKSTIYAHEGISYRWIVDPIGRWLEVSKLRSSEWVVIDKVFGDLVVSLEPFQEISFNLGELWPPPTVHRGVPEQSAEELHSELIEASK